MARWKMFYKNVKQCRKGIHFCKSRGGTAVVFSLETGLARFLLPVCKMFSDEMRKEL